MIGRSDMNERLPYMTPHRMLFDASVSPKKVNKKDTTNILF